MEKIEDNKGKQPVIIDRENTVKKFISDKQLASYFYPYTKKLVGKLIIVCINLLIIKLLKLNLMKLLKIQLLKIFLKSFKMLFWILLIILMLLLMDLILII